MLDFCTSCTDDGNQYRTRPAVTGGKSGILNRHGTLYTWGADIPMPPPIELIPPIPPPPPPPQVAKS